MYKIGELSKLCRLPVKTLRYWGDEGLLVPDHIDPFTGYRYYSAARLADCSRIVALKELGFSLGEIRQHLMADPAELVGLIDAKQRELKAELLRTESRLRRLDAIRQSITEGEKKMFDMVIRPADAHRAAFARRIFKTKAEAYAEAERMRSCLPAQITGRRTLIVNYETEYREENFDLAVCVEITGKLPADCPWEARDIMQSGEIAVLVCRREELDDACRAMTEQLGETPAQIVGAFVEVYYDDGTVELKVPVRRLSRPAVDSGTAAEMPFENDPDAVGAWAFADLVPSREQYAPQSRKYGDYENFWLKKLVFLPGGAGYWIVRGWTKQYLFTKAGVHRYSIETAQGETLLFLEMDIGGLTARGGLPQICVFRKTDSREYTPDDLRIRDRVDYPFIADTRVLGEWKVWDYLRDKSQLDPLMSRWSHGLYWKSVHFQEDGTVQMRFGEDTALYSQNWTQGTFLDLRREIAEAYEILMADGEEFLLAEWKSGDYQFGGRVPGYYVFKRA